MQVNKPRHYILSYSAKRKDARRKIAARFDTKQACIDYFTHHYNEKYNYSIYTYDWKFIQNLSIEQFKKDGGEKH